MRVFQINGGVFGSTGKIMFGIAEVIERQGSQAMCASPITSTNRSKQPNHKYVKIGSYHTRRVSVLLDRITGMQGCFALFATNKLLHKISKFHPDIMHLHNIHGSYVNLPMLFRYIKKHKVRVVWTLHDCWAFTGQCPYFDMVKCGKWQTGCHDCQQYREYPGAYVDRTKTMWKLKKKWLTGVENMTIITPSQWLADLVKLSFLKDYPINVINNGIDLSVFKPTESDFRKKYHCESKYILLGVAFGWDKRKGLDVFVELAKRLDERYQIVLVGTDGNVDKQLPGNIISIHRTQNQKELAEMYTTADLFVNPTREENYPTVNMEAIACGTPVLTFRTGGSPENISNTCGCVVDCDDTDAMEREIIRICQGNFYLKEICFEQAKVFDMNARFEEYVELYNKEER